ncbi:Resolvase, HTH domain containing protein [uncultured Caudovirales phage]|uniref:Resolvase, HTH domain containing protein n=1 Tax=uncultured Caudovirales phage TaxID=2100421 RepID=A0A6J5KNB8_9CAUD|nr:Resolvase, HTH domain containing protein [uncultured Caudovirales phage]
MTETEKRPVGRPSLYDPSFCDEVVELGRKGKSVEQIASILNVSLRTMYSWRDAHEEFLHALDDAKQYEQYWWEEQAQAYLVENKDSDKINTSLWSRSMAARFPKKYRESTKTEITGADGAPLISGIQVTFVKPE